MMEWTTTDDGEGWALAWGASVYQLTRKSDSLINLEVDGFPAGRFTGEHAVMALAKEYVEKFVVDAREEVGE